jgi:type VI secretion system protein ImpF
LAELTHRERLQPSLLDRLVDDERDRTQEAPDSRFMTLSELREVVKRDLAWLLNTCHLAATEDLSECSEVARSVLNFGVPDLTGVSLNSIDVGGLERMVRQAIIDFEPRILRDTVRVQAFVSEGQMNRNALTFQIEGDLWAEPVPVPIVLESNFDLESGVVVVRE